jgi:hypothetical protein
MAWTAYSGREPNTTRSLLHRRVPHGRTCGGSDASKDQCNSLGIIARHVGAAGRDNRFVNSVVSTLNEPSECIYIQDKRVMRDRANLSIADSDRSTGAGKTKAIVYDLYDAGASVRLNSRDTNGTDRVARNNHKDGPYTDRWVFGAAGTATVMSSAQYSDFHKGDSQLRRA